MNGISVLIKEVPERWGHREKVTIGDPGNRHSPDTGSVGALILDFPASRL